MIDVIKSHWGCVLVGVAIGFLVLPRVFGMTGAPAVSDS